jgi:hypothetical protein
MAFTGISLARAITKTSNNWLKPLPLRAQGTGTCPILPHCVQATRGTEAWMNALCSKKRGYS